MLMHRHPIHQNGRWTQISISFDHHDDEKESILRSLSIGFSTNQRERPNIYSYARRYSRRCAAVCLLAVYGHNSLYASPSSFASSKQGQQHPSVRSVVISSATNTVIKMIPSDDGDNDSDSETKHRRHNSPPIVPSTSITTKATLCLGLT
jgi:hypothetical protein